MPLIIYDAANTAPVNEKQTFAILRVHRHGGLFSFNQAAVDLMEIKEGSTPVFGRDEVKAGLWFMRFADTGIRVKQRKKNVGFNNKFLANEILSCFAAAEKSIQLKISPDQVVIDGNKFYRLEWIPAAKKVPHSVKLRKK